MVIKEIHKPDGTVSVQKQCTTCKEWKELNKHFYQHKYKDQTRSEHGNYYSRCKSCHSANVLKNSKTRSVRLEARVFSAITNADDTGVLSYEQKARLAKKLVKEKLCLK